MVYIIAFQPLDTPILLESFNGLEYSISNVTLLGSDAPIDWSLGRDGLRLEAAGNPPFKHAAVFKVTLDQVALITGTGKSNNIFTK